MSTNERACVQDESHNIMLSITLYSYAIVQQYNVLVTHLFQNSVNMIICELLSSLKQQFREQLNYLKIILEFGSHRYIMINDGHTTNFVLLLNINL